MERFYGKIVRKAYRRAGLEDWETRPVWWNKAPRVLTKGFWKEARALNRKAGKLGVRYKIFPSMIDWLDDMPAGIIDQDGNWLKRDEVFADFLSVVHECQNLDWLLLTKRPQNFTERIETCWSEQPETPLGHWLHEWLFFGVGGTNPTNVWIGVSVEDQKRADERIPHLLRIPAVVRFLSCEPLLGPINLVGPYDGPFAFPLGTGIHWVIVGGESGAGFREMDLAAALSIGEQCVDYEVPFFMKQDSGLYPGKQGRIPDEWWVQQWPKAARLRQGFGEARPIVPIGEEVAAR